MPELWPFRPELGCTETLEWYSEVLGSRTGEQRLSLRYAPRQMFQYATRLLDGQQFARARAFMRRNAAEPLYVPVWGEQVAYGVVGSGDDVLTFDTSWGDWRVGSFLVVWQSDTQYAVCEIAAVTPTDITLTDDVGLAFVAAFIVPIRTALTMTGFNVSRGKVHSDVSAAFTVVDNIDLAANYVSSYEQYQSLDVMTDPPVLITDVAETIVRSADYIDSALGLIAVETERNYVDFGQTITYHDERFDLWKRRLWLHALRGKQNIFWFPTFNQDLVLQATVAGASTTVSVASIGPASLYIDKHVMILKTNGTRYFRKITNAAAAGGGVDNLTISSSLGTILTVADVAMFSFMSLVRLDSDSVDISHSYELCSTISIPITEVSNETAELTNLTVGRVGVASGTATVTAVSAP
jgi:hypothetical protein